MSKVKKILFIIVSSFLLAFALSGCSLMPFHSNFKYVRGTNYGYLGSLNQVYKQSLIDQKNAKLKRR